MRENAPEFKPIIESGTLGLPCLVVGDNEEFIFTEEQLDTFIQKELSKVDA